MAERLRGRQRSSGLPRVSVDSAFAALEGGRDVVVGPATDGGYYLLGVADRVRPRPLLAGVPWSTNAVLRETLVRCERAGLSVTLLDDLGDVDTPEDLARLRDDVESGRILAPAVGRLLRGPLARLEAGTA